MAPRVTVAQLRKEARSRLQECSNGKTISRMNRTELLQFLGCVGMELDAAATYQAQQDQRDADRAIAVPQGFFPREPRGYYAQPKTKKPRRVVVDDQVSIAPRRRNQGGSGHCMGGSGAGTYREFVRVMLPQMHAQGMSSQDAMKAVGAAWREERHGAGLVPAGQRGGALVQAGQEGDGFASDLSKWSGRAASGLALSGALGPEVAAFTEPAAGVAKGVSYISGLFG